MNSNLVVLVLGSVQDGGYPHAGCKKNCCKSVWNNPHLHRLPACIATVDIKNRKFYLFDITPNLKEQLHFLESYNCELAGVFITHAHVGHYTGLIHLGREAMGTKGLPVYAMQKMAKFIRSNGPWSQLVDLENIEIRKLKNERTVDLNKRISINLLFR